MAQEQISIFKTRSFILVVGAIVLTVMQSNGVDLGLDKETLGMAALSLAPTVMAVWAYIERLFGKKKVVLRTKK